jgi:hypothetical protein
MRPRVEGGNGAELARFCYARMGEGTDKRGPLPVTGRDAKTGSLACGDSLGGGPHWSEERARPSDWSVRRWAMRNKEMGFGGFGLGGRRALEKRLGQ